jgi:hypothetical protein
VSIVTEISLRYGIIKTDLYLKSEEACKTFLEKKKRVLILGDSFSLENPGSAVMRIKAEFPEVHFLNLSGQGFGPEQYLEQLNRFGYLFKPDVILVNYYAGNDLTDTLYSLNKAFFNKWLVAIANRSYLLSHLRSLKARWAAKKRIDSIENQIAERIRGPVLNPFLVDLGRHHPDYLIQNLLIKSVDAEKALEKNKEILKLIADNAKTLNSKLLIHIFPNTVQVNGTHYPFYSKLGFELSQDFPKSSIPQKLLLSFCKEERLKCYDLLPEFRKRGRYEKWLYLSNDDHWNSDGNLLAAGIISTHLRPALKD